MDAQEGIKFDSDKLMVSLFPPEALLGAAEVLTFGAKKYDVDNWKYVDNAKQRYTDALLRHYCAHQSGEKVDPETGLSHLKHILANAAFLVYFEENGEYNKEEKD